MKICRTLGPLPSPLLPLLPLVSAALAAIFSVAIAGAETVNYQRDIKPVLQARCYACHGALKQEAGLRLDTGLFIRRGGDSGAAVKAGQPSASLLLERVAADEDSGRMPPEGEPLSTGEIDRLRTWIRDGAKSPSKERAESNPDEHWAFQPPQRPALPKLEHQHRGTNPIDAFVDASLQRHGLTPRPTAPKHVLLRRVYLDLIGLPPTREELRAFLADNSPDAYERTVEQLLEDKRHGERWGRHWMDVWRYSDWYGRRDVNDVRNSASQIFRWRDWIVQSINEGKGYDRMLQEMLASDEMFPEDYDASVATGYLIRNYYSLNPNDWMRSAVEHTGKAFLGLTFNCAHCHDHKYDPIQQEDYFRLRAFFEPIYIRQDRVPGEADPGPFQDYSYGGSRAVQRLGALRVYDRDPEAPTWFYTGGDERNRVEDRGAIPPGVPTILEPETLDIQPVQLPPMAWYPGLRPEIHETLLADLRRAVAAAKESLSATPAAETDGGDALTLAEAAYAQALEQAKAIGHPGSLAGEQSLLLDATQGRAIVQNGLESLVELNDGLTIAFELMILQDAHVNFQLVKDNKQGLTADYVGWDQGRILAYQPGSTAAVEVGRYDIAKDQSRFQVQLTLQPSDDQALLTVRSVTDGALLVENLPTALNGWTPIGNDLPTISFDARPGSVVVIDSVQVTAPTENARSFSFDFESPEYSDGSTPAGIEGWRRSTFSQNGGTAVVSRTAGNKELREAANRLYVARRQSDGPSLRRRAAEARVAAAEKKLASLEARIEAERARYISPPPPQELDQLMRNASLAERLAKLSEAQSELLSQDVSLLTAEAKPMKDAKRSEEIRAAKQRLAEARAAVDAARAALADEKLATTYAPLSAQFPRESTGRRRGLALWMTRPSHPLTARVAVNHIWMRHFRSPLVDTMYDFGRNGAHPTHPQLLDWLAVEFTDSGWDMKRLHRLIVTSEAYQRLSSVGDAQQSAAADPENRLLWRYNSWRMESEVVRDSLLYVGGRLDLTRGGIELENKDALTTNRRTLYYSCHPEAGGKSALGKLFDAPNPLDCYRRATSVVPQQALALTNSEFVHQSSVAIVKELQKSANRPKANSDRTEQFMEDLFAQILCRPPSKKERLICREALARQQQLSPDPLSAAAITQARESLARVLLNHNDFLTVR